ncbi:MAG: hypothetical protein HQM12_17175, partial [SAR324 cluster bacterium]|nr:hypothetical protein [SAR324 cluster bacterium]
MQIKISIFLMIWWTGIVSCYSLDNQSENKVWAKLDVGIKHKSAISSQLSRSASAVPSIETIKSAYIIAVPEAFSDVTDYGSLNTYYDRNILNLSSQSVSLYLPYATPMRIVEVAFDSNYSLEQILRDHPQQIFMGVSDPVNLQVEDGDINIDV